MSAWRPGEPGAAGDRRPPFAATTPRHEDATLRGRTYAIPFEDVWQAALAIADGGARGWRLLRADDDEGIIIAEADRLLRRATDEVEIRITLDEDAQTRVDAFSCARGGRFDLGVNARRLRRLFRRLDRDVAARHATRTRRAVPERG